MKIKTGFFFNQDDRIIGPEKEYIRLDYKNEYIPFKEERKEDNV